MSAAASTAFDEEAGHHHRTQQGSAIRRAAADPTKGPPKARTPSHTEVISTAEQRNAARHNIKRAAAAARQKRTIAALPAKNRTALGREGAKAARQRAAD